jgi:hypothetical protein
MCLRSYAYAAADSRSERDGVGAGAGAAVEGFAERGAPFRLQR